MKRRALRIAILAALAIVAPPAGASASTAEVNFNGTLFYFAAAGETNDLTLERAGADYVLSDPGAPITPMAGCVAVDANTVTCAAAAVREADLRMGDLNDTAAVGASVTGIGDPDFGDPGVAIRGEAGDDTLTGGPNVTNSLAGQEEFSDGPGTDVLVGGALRDTLDGSDGNDQLTGAGGPDSLDGGVGDDSMIGGEGNDSFDGGSSADGADVIAGGGGRDFLSYSDRTAGVSVDTDGVADDGESCPGAGCEGDNVTAIESLSGGAGNDTLTGSAGADSIFGGDGNDAISGGGGPDDLGGSSGDDSVSGDADKDLIFGDEGNDIVDGGDGDDQFVIFSDETGAPGTDADTYTGGAGTDLIDYTDSGDGQVTVDLDGVADDGFGCPGPACEGDNVGADVEDVIGTAGADTLTGSGSANEIEGGPGADTITGGGGGDGLFGGDGGDSLDGGSGIDSLEAGVGTDALRSRDGEADQVDCGSSLDTLLGDLADDPEATCESVSTGLVIGAVKKGKKGKKGLKLKLTCPAAEGIDCKAKVKLRKGKKVVGSGKATIPSGGSKQVKLKLKGKAKGTLLASAGFVDAAGQTVTTTRRVKVGK